MAGCPGNMATQAREKVIIIKRVCHHDATVMSKSHLGWLSALQNGPRVHSGWHRCSPSRPPPLRSFIWLFRSGHCDSSCMDGCMARRTSLGVMSAETTPHAELISPESLFSASYHDRPRFPVSCHCIPLQDDWSGNAGCCCYFCRRRVRKEEKKPIDDTEKSPIPQAAQPRKGGRGRKKKDSQGQIMSRAKLHAHAMHVAKNRKDARILHYITTCMRRREGGVTWRVAVGPRATAHEYQRAIRTCMMLQRATNLVVRRSGRGAPLLRPTICTSSVLRSSPDQPGLLPVKRASGHCSDLSRAPTAPWK